MVLAVTLVFALAAVGCGRGGGDEEVLEPEVRRPPSGDPASIVATAAADPAPTSDEAAISTTVTTQPVRDVGDFDLATTRARVLCPGHEADLLLDGEPTGPLVAEVVQDLTRDLDDDGVSERVLVVSCDPVAGVVDEAMLEAPETEGQRSILALAAGDDALVQLGGPIPGRTIHDVEASLVVERSRTIDGDRVTTFSPLSIVAGHLTAVGGSVLVSAADPAMPVGLGGLEIGAPFPLLAYNVGGTITISDTGSDGDCVVVHVQNGPEGIRGLGGDGTLASVEVTNPDVKTDTGLSIGSSGDEVLSTYQDIVQSARDPGDPSREFLVASPPDSDGLTAVFEIVGGAVVGHRVGEPGWASALDGCN